MRISTLAGPQQARRADPFAHGRDMPPATDATTPAASARRSVSGWPAQRSCIVVSHAQPVGLVARQVLALAFEDRRHLVVGDRVLGRDGVRPDVDRRPRDRQHAAVPGRREAAEERALVDEDARLVAGHDVEMEQRRIEEARRTGRRHDGPGVDRLDVAHRPRQLALDLGVDEVAHRGVVHLVDHRVPDRPAVLQPVEVDRSVRGEGREVGGPAVVLVDEPARAVADHHRRVAARAVGDRRLDVDRHAELAVVATEARAPHRRRCGSGSSKPSARSLVSSSRLG